MEHLHTTSPVSKHYYGLQFPALLWLLRGGAPTLVQGEAAFNFPEGLECWGPERERLSRGGTRGCAENKDAFVFVSSLFFPKWETDVSERREDERGSGGEQWSSPSRPAG